jgi:hypothetical protein
MPGKGFYTTFNSPKTDPKKLLLEKMFKGGGESNITPPFIGLDNAESRAVAVDTANKILRAEATGGVTLGDPGFFPDGVDLAFTGQKASISIPDKVATADDAWNKPGDPANGYVPDITSPGPGLTEPNPAETDPKIKASDINPKVIPGEDANTKNPSAAGRTLYNANHLGAQGSILSKLGG